MTAKEFIEKKLNDLKITEKPVQTFKSQEDLADFIFKSIMSKKFRKFSVLPEYREYIKEAILDSIKNNFPIEFVISFGAYKLWRFEETPEADWAELFTLMYYAKWLKPITEVYKPGVHFDFNSDEIIVERLNNIPIQDTEDYARSFKIVLNFLEKFLPENLKFTLTPIRSSYKPEEFEKDLKEEVMKLQEKLGGFPILSDAIKQSVELNVKLKPNQNNDPFWREKVELLHQAYYNVSHWRPYMYGKNKIFVWVNKKNGKRVCVGTTKTSVAKFWVGVGALKKTGDEFLEYVLSPSQLEKSKFEWEDISINELSGKNFKKIRILD